MADHVDQADIKICTTGSETSKYAVWGLVKGIRSSSDDTGPIGYLGQFRNDKLKQKFLHNFTVNYTCLGGKWGHSREDSS